MGSRCYTQPPQAAEVQSALTSTGLMCLSLVDQLVLTAQIMLLRALPGLLLLSISPRTHACTGDEGEKLPKSQNAVLINKQNEDL